MLPLPEGEGRGEGERILGMPQRCGFRNHFSESGFQTFMNFLAPAAFAFAAAIPVVILFYLLKRKRVVKLVSSSRLSSNSSTSVCTLLEEKLAMLAYTAR